VEKDPRDLAATPERVRAVFAAGGLPEAAAARALALAVESPSRAAWRRFLGRSFLVAGSALLLAAVIFFFAFNWQALGRFEKLGLVAAGIAGAAVAAWQRPRRISGQVSLMAACVLAGALLAIYGQTYQTGADPYQLFLLWAVLIAPWVVASGFAGAWVLWVVLLNTALSLFWAQVLDPDDPMWLSLALFAVNALAWAWFEVGERVGWAFAKARWPSRLLTTACLVLLEVPALALILDEHASDDERLPRWLGALAMAGLLVAIWLRYRRGARRDLYRVAVALAAAAIVLSAAFGRLLLEEWDLDEVGVLMLGVLVLGQVAGMVALLRRWSRPEDA
jgi:uncharacterized membrane protein